MGNSSPLECRPLPKELAGSSGVVSEGWPQLTGTQTAYDVVEAKLETQRHCLPARRPQKLIQRGDFAHLDLAGFDLVRRVGRVLKTSCPDLKTVSPSADFVIEGYIDPREQCAWGIDNRGPADLSSPAITTTRTFCAPRWSVDWNSSPAPRSAPPPPGARRALSSIAPAPVGTTWDAPRSSRA